jgi:phage repressor protein C with HTH and peptisase S24 domain
MLNAIREETPVHMNEGTKRGEASAPSERTPMLQHADVWRGIDRLAAKNGLSASGLARRAGLDPTAFNPSKRTTREGRSRWPSTESIAKVLAVTGETFGGFVSLTGAVGTASDQATGKLNGRVTIGRSIPVISFAKLKSETCFDNSGQPVGKSWGRVIAPAIGDKDVFAVEMSGSEFDPVYRDGDLLVASRDSEVRRADRVLIGCADDTVRIVRIGRQDSDGVSVEPVSTGKDSITLRNVEIRWIARIVWASQ